MSIDGVPEVKVAMLSRSGNRERNEDAGGYWLQGPVCCVLSDGAGGHGRDPATFVPMKGPSPGSTRSRVEYWNCWGTPAGVRCR